MRPDVLNFRLLQSGNAIIADCNDLGFISDLQDFTKFALL